jgi:hypothetical protein
MENQKGSFSNGTFFCPALRGTEEIAQYKDQEIDEYKSNPFIEALPEILEVDTVIKRVSYFPNQSDEQRKLSKAVRLHLVQSLSSFVFPMPAHLSIEQRLSRLIRYGYIGRNPLSPQFNRQFAIGFRELLDGGVDESGTNFAGIRSSAAAFAIIGVSGQGKTTAMENMLLLYPQVIQHANYKGTILPMKQLVWLKLNCPFDGSIKGLCINFFQAVDSVLGTNYFKTIATKRHSVDVLIPMMAHVASIHGVGVLVIDEIQNLSQTKSGGAEAMLKFFTQLINTIGVPIVLIGTFKAMQLFSGSFSQARRNSGQGDLIMDRMEPGEGWDNFIEFMWQYQWTAVKTPLTSKLKSTMYELTQGIIDIAVKLYMIAQWELISDVDEGKNEKITCKLLREVAKEHLRLVTPMIRALKQNKRELLAQIDDLIPGWGIFDKYLQKAQEKVHIEGVIRSSVMHEDAMEKDENSYVELIKTAIEFGASPEQAEEVASAVMKNNDPGESLLKLKKQVVDQAVLLLDVSEKGYEPKDLRNVDKEKTNDPDALYKALDEFGFVDHGQQTKKTG